MSGFVALHLRRFLEHPLRTLLSLTGIGTACALLVSVLALSESLTGSIARTAELAGRADVQVSGVTDTGFDERLFFDVDRAPGVAAAIPYVQTPVILNGVRVLLLGFDGRAAALDRTGDEQLQRQLSGPSVNANGVFAGPQLARLADLRPGSEVSVTVRSQVQVTRVLGLLGDGPLTRFNDGIVAFAALPLAEALAVRPHRLDGIYVVAAQGVSPMRLERSVADVVGGRAVVSSPRLLADQASTVVAPLRGGLLTVSAFALLVAAFVVFNTMNMAALERRRELATLRALGGRRRVLLAWFLGEAACLGLVGAAGGIAIGAVLAHALVSRVPTNLVAAFDVRVDFIFPVSAIPLALVLGMGFSVVAAALAGRRAVRVAPVEAMRPEGVLETRGDAERVHWPAALGGLAALLIGLTLSYVDSRSVALPAAVLFWVGAIVATFGFSAPLAATAAWLAARLATPGRLAAASLARAPRRAFVTASAVAAAVALLVAQTGTEHNVARSLEEGFDALARTDVIVTTAAPENLASDQLIPDRLAAVLQQLPGVARVATGADAYATIGDDRVLLRGVVGDSALPEVRLASADARRAVASGSAVIVTAQFARNHGLHSGDTLLLPTPSGVKRLGVATIVATFSADRGSVVLSLAKLQDWFVRPGLTRIELTAGPTPDGSSLRQRVASATAFLGDRVRVESGRDAASELEGPFRQVGSAFDAIEFTIVVAAGLSLLNTLAISVVERRRELGILRAVGTSRRQVRRSIGIEAGAIGALGTAVGMSMGAFAHRLAVLSTQSVGGLPVVYRFDPTPLALAAVAAVVVTLASVQGPAWRAARLNVIDAIGYE